MLACYPLISEELFVFSDLTLFSIMWRSCFRPSTIYAITVRTNIKMLGLPECPTLILSTFVIAALSPLQIGSPGFVLIVSVQSLMERSWSYPPSSLKSYALQWKGFQGQSIPDSLREEILSEHHRNNINSTSALISSNLLFSDLAHPNMLKDFWKYPKISFDIVTGNCLGKTPTKIPSWGLEKSVKGIRCFIFRVSSYQMQLL